MLKRQAESMLHKLLQQNPHVHAHINNQTGKLEGWQVVITHGHLDEYESPTGWTVGKQY